MDVLTDLITAATASEHQDQDARNAAVTALLGQHPDVDLAALETQAVAAWGTERGNVNIADLKPEEIPAHLARMEQLAHVVVTIRAQREKAAAAPAPAAPTTTEATPAAPAPAAAPAAPAAAPAAPEAPAAETPAEPAPAETPAAPEAATETPAEGQAPAAETPPAPAAEPATPAAVEPSPAPAAPAPPVVEPAPAEPAGAVPDISPPVSTPAPAVQPEVVVSPTPTEAPAAPAGVAAAPDALAASAAPGTALAVQQPAAPAVPYDWTGMAFDTVTADGSPAAAAGAGGAQGLYTITAGAGVPQHTVGQMLNGMNGLGGALALRMDQLQRGLSEPMPHVVAAASDSDWGRAYNSISRHGVATVALPAAAQQFVMRNIEDEETLTAACNEHRLRGGSLTAAVVAGTPGWCAPCDVRYEFCPPEVAEHLLDIPTVIAPRGCIQYPVEPDFSAIYSMANMGFCYDAEDYENPAPPDPDVPGPLNKPCVDVPCPSNENTLLDPCGLCIRASILLATAYPEAVAKFMSRAMVAWTIKQNMRNITQMLTAIGAANTVTVPQAVTGPGATATILEVVEYYNTWLRYRHMLGDNTTMEALFPLWARGVMRADLSKQMGIDLKAVTDQQLDAYLLARKIRPQWIRGLSEAYRDPAQGTPNIPASTLFAGGANAPGTPATPFAGGAGSIWPASFQLVMYPAGTFARARLGLVNIEGGLIDSALLSRNQRLLLFIEEASAIIKRCYQGLIINVPLCASGQTGGAGLTPLCGQPVETP